MERITLLDILRGIAILGTLGTNIWIFSSYSMTDSGLDIPVDQISEFLQSLSMVFVNGKFLGMLTILFGVGLEIKYRQALRRNFRWPWVYLWSSFLLLIDGILHYLLLIEFDILRGYALTSMIVAFLVNRSDRVINLAMWITGFTHIAVASVSTDSPTRGSFVGPLLPGAETWLGQVQERWANLFDPYAEFIFIIPMSVFLFLCGVKLMRAGAFSYDDNGRRIQRKLMKWGLSIGLPLNAIAHFIHYLPYEINLLDFDRYVFAQILSFGYIGLIAVMWQNNRFQWLGARFTEVGRTALSCYILQNLIASILFLQWGLGLSTVVKGDAILTILAWFMICGLLMMFAHFWLKRYPTGPFEITWKWGADLPRRNWRILSQHSYPAPSRKNS